MRLLAEQMWVCYWHPDKKWVTLRPVKDAYELVVMKSRAISPDRAKLYDGVAI